MMNMSMNSTPSANRIHVGFFGNRNTGKSSLVNAITGQSLAIVSDTKGTTTDPVLKAIELFPLGPAVIIDTAGLDDQGELGALRIGKTHQVLNKTDIAVLVVDATLGKTAQDHDMIARFRHKGIPYVVAYNKKDLLDTMPCHGSRLTVCNGSCLEPGTGPGSGSALVPNEIWVSAKTGENIDALRDLIARQRKQEAGKHPIVADLVSPFDLVLLVVPIDESAPKGRLILPQQQTIRELLEARAVSIVVKETELEAVLDSLATKPKLVITDSQVFSQVSAVTPPDVSLTSFSILFARHKGHLEQFVEGVRTLDTLRDGDTILISEGCTHHRQCNDIGRVKLPGWIRGHARKNLNFEFSSGTEFPDDLSKYRLVVHCGGCMLNEREMKYRQLCARNQNVPITNYGMTIAHIHGILRRSLEVFPGIAALLG